MKKVLKYIVAGAAVAGAGVLVATKIADCKRRHKLEESKHRFKKQCDCCKEDSCDCPPFISECDCECNECNSEEVVSRIDKLIEEVDKCNEKTQKHIDELNSENSTENLVE